MPQDLPAGQSEPTQIAPWSLGGTSYSLFASRALIALALCYSCSVQVVLGLRSAAEAAAGASKVYRNPSGFLSCLSPIVFQAPSQHRAVGSTNLVVNLWGVESENA